MIRNQIRKFKSSLIFPALYVLYIYIYFLNSAVGCYPANQMELSGASFVPCQAQPARWFSGEKCLYIFNIKEFSFLFQNVWWRALCVSEKRYYIILKLKIKQPTTIVIFLVDIKRANMYNIYYVSALFIYIYTNFILKRTL